MNDENLRDSILLVFANKQDLPNALRAPEMTDALDLHAVKQRNWYIQPCSALTDGQGLFEGLEWLSSNI